MRTPVIESQTLWRSQLLQSTELNFQSVSLASSKIRINKGNTFPIALGPSGYKDRLGSAELIPSANLIEHEYLYDQLLIGRSGPIDYLGS